MILMEYIPWWQLFLLVSGYFEIDICYFEYNDLVVVLTGTVVRVLTACLCVGVFILLGLYLNWHCYSKFDKNTPKIKKNKYGRNLIEICSKTKNQLLKINPTNVKLRSIANNLIDKCRKMWRSPKI
ncbi:unnamed protein product [Meganyctiphanes norvegica]|uniref:Uncharacterized protein n=1 Tax=Meganyctiphanes norvegica TaxID=48144 RepID=A0AAV2QDU1_MEGNR